MAGSTEPAPGTAAEAGAATSTAAAAAEAEEAPAITPLLAEMLLRQAHAEVSAGRPVLRPEGHVVHKLCCMHTPAWQRTLPVLHGNTHVADLITVLLLSCTAGPGPPHAVQHQLCPHCQGHRASILEVQQWVAQNMAVKLELLGGMNVLVRSAQLQEAAASSDSTAAVADAIPLRLRQILQVEAAAGADLENATVVLVGGQRLCAADLANGALSEVQDHEVRVDGKFLHVC